MSVRSGNAEQRAIGGGGRRDAGRPPGAAAAEIAGACLAVRARLLARAITCLYDHALSGGGLDLGAAQLNLLVVADRVGRCSPARLGTVLWMERSTVSRNIEALEARGWLGAERGEGGRVREVWLTPAGRGAIRGAIGAWRDAQEKARDMLGPQAAAALAMAGDRLLLGAGAGETSAGRGRKGGSS